MVIDRLSQRFSGDFLKKEGLLTAWKAEDHINYNITRGESNLVYRLKEEKFFPEKMIWGFGTERREDQRIINARAEGILSQPSFRFEIREKRVVVPVDSFYCCVVRDQKKMCYRVVPFTDRPMYIAAIWEPRLENSKAYTIITTKTNKDLSDLTDRMPLIFFDIESATNWCREMNVSELSDWLQPSPSGKLKYYRISHRLLEGENSALLHEAVEQHLTLFDQ